MENFRSFSYRLLFRCIVCGLGLYEFYHNPSYWYDTQQLWEGYPHHVCSNAVQIVYLLQLAYHLEDLGSAIVQGNARKRADFAAMVVHHIVTSLLLIGSSHLKTHRIGVIVSTLHAVTDVPKDFTQVAKQLEWRYCKLAGFVTLLATWIAARVILYPFKYVWSVFAESRQFLVHAEGGMSDTALNIFMTLLSVLVLLNTMWCHMLIKLVIRVLKEGDTSTADPTMRRMNLLQQHHKRTTTTTIRRRILVTVSATAMNRKITSTFQCQILALRAAAVLHTAPVTTLQAKKKTAKTNNHKSD